MRALDGLDVQIKIAGLGVGAYRGIAGVCKRARLLAAETGDVVLIATESLVLGCLQLVAAKVGSNNGPHDFVCARQYLV
jgi:hypothetical protein